ncbi:protein ZBED8-like isoform X2 [Sphaerodactylus townsendi]|uniref:protein ZBED8-like isoform X2 n=1 Tax=Sphaerodactylus townsendi TaxID=933632 RepID=UPI002025FAD4|nr:protein ZBED8-like isoform X2 [Sphaerodactylus townsendi]
MGSSACSSLSRPNPVFFVLLQAEKIQAVASPERTAVHVLLLILVFLWRIARAMKPDTIAKDLLLPVAKDIVRVMIGDEFVTKLSAISLSNDTIHRRIDDMSADILDQGFPACWLSSLNTEVDLLWKMIFVVLLQRLPREFLIW